MGIPSIVFSPSPSLKQTCIKLVCPPCYCCNKENKCTTFSNGVWGVSFYIFENSLLISWAEFLQSFCFTLASHQPAAQEWGFTGQLSAQKRPQKMDICENISKVLGSSGYSKYPQILWISKSIALSHLLATAEMVYHQLLNFSFPSPRSDPSCVWRTQKRNQPFYKSHSLTCWERKKKEQKDFKIGPSRNKLNKHSVRQTNDPSRLSCFQ